MFLKEISLAAVLIIGIVSPVLSQDDATRVTELLDAFTPPSDPDRASDDIEFMEIRTLWLNSRTKWLKAERDRMTEEMLYRTALNSGSDQPQTVAKVVVPPTLATNDRPRIDGAMTDGSGAWLVSLKYPDGRVETARQGGSLLNGGRVTKTAKRSVTFVWKNQTITVN